MSLTCSQQEAAEEIGRVQTAWNQLATTMKAAAAKGTYKSTDVIVTEGKQLETDLAGWLTTTGQKIASAGVPIIGGLLAPDYCLIKAEAKQFFDRVLIFSRKFSATTGEVNPVEKYIPPALDLTVWDYAKIGVVVVAGYFVWRWAKEALFSDAYPVDRLPQYAGGRRKRK
jgi:hypothetical protein